MALVAERVVTELVADTTGHDAKIRTSAQAVDQASAKIQQSTTAAERSANRAFTSIAQGAAKSGTALSQFALQDLRAAQALGELIRSLNQTARASGTVTTTQLEAARAIGQFAQAANAQQAALGRIGATSGATRMGMQQLSYQIGDVSMQWSLGVEPMRIFAQQSGQVVQALQLMGGQGNAFLRFLGGPWGIALSAAAVVMLPLIGRLFDTRTELEKATDDLAENARRAGTTRQAQEAFGRTLPGVTAAIREETAALREQNRTLEENQRLVVREAENRLAEIRRQLDANIQDQGRISRELREAEANLRTIRAAGDPAATGVAAARIEDLTRQLAALQQRQAEIRASLYAAEVGVRDSQIPLLQGEVEAGLDGAEAAARRYREELARLNSQLRQNLITEAQYRERLTAAGRRRDREIEAARDRDRDRRTPEQAYRDFERELRREGIRPTSGYRTRAQQERLYRTLGPGNAAPPGRSDHEFWRAFDFPANVDRAALARAAARANVTLGPELVHGRQRHLHQRFMASERGSGGGEEELARLAEQRAQREAQFQDELRQLDAALLAARQRLAQAGQVSFAAPLVPGNIDLNNRPVVRNQDGSISTVRSMSFGTDQGEVLIPTISPDGRELSDEEAIALYRQTGQHLGIFRTPGDASSYAERLHDAQEELYSGPGRMLGKTTEDLLAIRERQVSAAEHAADLEVQELEASRDRLNATYEEAERQGRISEAQREQLVIRNNQVTAELANLVRLREQQRLDEQRYQIAVEDLRDAQSIEQARGQFARTIAQRRDSELRLLELAHEEELRAIERARTQEGLNNAQRKRLDREEAAARERYDLARRAVQERNLSPLQQFIDRAPQSAEEMNEALEGVAANGLQAVNDGLAEAIGNMIQLGGTTGRIVSQMIADVARLVLMRNVTGPIAERLSRLFGGGGADDNAAKLGEAGAKVAAGGAAVLTGATALGISARQLERAAAALLVANQAGDGGGGGGGGGLAAIASLFASSGGGGGGLGSLGSSMGFATGGSIVIGGRGGVDRNLISLNGVPLARVSRGETLNIVPQAKAVTSPLGAARRAGAGQSSYIVNVHASDAVLTHTVRRWVAEGMQDAIAIGSTQGVRMTEARSAKRLRNTL